MSNDVQSGLEAKALEMLRDWAVTLSPEDRADLLLESVRAIYFASMGGRFGGPYVNPERDSLDPVIQAAMDHHERTRARARGVTNLSAT